VLSCCEAPLARCAPHASAVATGCEDNPVSRTRISTVVDLTSELAPPGGAFDVLAGLDPEQRAVAESLRGPVCVLAGAGTGKTRAITHRIAHGVRTGVYPPHRVLAVTFTTRAAGEMRDRLRHLGAGGVQARTFHSAALRQLKFFWPQAVGGALPRIVATKAPLVAEAASRQRLRPEAALVRDLAAEIEWAKVSRISAEDYPVRAAAARRDVAATDAATVARVYAAYDETKRTREVIDFEDVLLLTVGMLEDSTSVAGQVRGQYQHFVVDEYQDVNPLQQRLLELWLGERDELCVVGDPSQTIYSFAGAVER
jgi:DNA helicase-2/ATP-dependent DNA helicase PcrA